VPAIGDTPDETFGDARLGILVAGLVVSRVATACFVSRGEVVSVAECVDDASGCGDHSVVSECG
jgi:hypothetical protein